MLKHYWYIMFQSYACGSCVTGFLLEASKQYTAESDHKLRGKNGTKKLGSWNDRTTGGDWTDQSVVSK